MNAEILPGSALYATIHSQPETIRTTLRSIQESAASVALTLKQARRVVLSGTGTSSHAAIVGEHLLRSVGIDATATTNFDFVIYPRPRDARDVLIAISHRGSKQYGAQAIAEARAAGMTVIGITGQDSPMAGTDVLIQTAPQEVSSTHTASYTANLAAIALIASRVAADTAEASALRSAVEALPGQFEVLLAGSSDLVPVARALARCRRLTLVGPGPNVATAREGALKVKESSYLTAEGFELETLLHGGLQAIEAGDVTVVIAAFGPGLPRACDAIWALDVLGAFVVVIADERVVQTLPAPGTGAHRLVVPYPATPEALSPVLAVLPLQLLAAYTAEILGKSGDSFRAEDPAYKQAGASYTL